MKNYKCWVCGTILTTENWNQLENSACPVPFCSGKLIQTF